MLGVPFGVHAGATAEVCHNLELPAGPLPTREVLVDHDFMKRRMDQYTGYFLVGWYSTKCSIEADDLRLRTKLFANITDAPVLLLVVTAAELGCGGAEVGIQAF